MIAARKPDDYFRTVPQHRMSSQPEPVNGTHRPRRAAPALLVLLLLLMALAGVMTLAVGLGVLLVLLAIPLFAAVHYLLWGWWLERVIRNQPPSEPAGETPPAESPPQVHRRF